MGRTEAGALISRKGLESHKKILVNKIQCKGVVVKGRDIYRMFVC